MELIKKIIRLLRGLQDRRLKRLLAAHDIRLVSLPETLKAWDAFVTYIDSAEADSDCSTRRILSRLPAFDRQEFSDKLLFFRELKNSSHECSEMLRFAEVPVQFDNDIFERLTADYARARTIPEQTSLIIEIFNELEPTTLELLFMLVEGEIERRPRPYTMAVSELIGRESAARERIRLLLSGELTDPVRWWIVKTLNGATGSPGDFLKDTLSGRHDIRLQCMFLTLFIKSGFEWADNFADNSASALDSLRFHQLASCTGRFLELINCVRA